MEDPAVFEEVHRFVFDLVARGAVTGLRIDHVDGLYAPEDYLRRLQERCGGAGGHERFFVVVEKILGTGEQLSPGWPVHGTTGYEFAGVVNNLFVDRRNERALDDIYRRFVRERREWLSFDDLAYRSKKQVMHETMSGDINSLGHQLNRFSERNRHFRDFTLYSLISTIKEVIACFPVYRTYVTEAEPVSEHDRHYIIARGRGREAARAGDARRDLRFHPAPAAQADRRHRAGRVRGARAVHRQVPADHEPGRRERDRGHDALRAQPAGVAERSRLRPDPLRPRSGRRARLDDAAAASAGRRRSRRLSTHDTKRGEDVRARLNVLSEIPGAWKDARRKMADAEPAASRPTSRAGWRRARNEEYLFYQTLAGAWPFERGPDTEAAFTDRIVAYMQKAMREAKLHTNWLSPDEAYEKAVERFVRANHGSPPG